MWKGLEWPGKGPGTHPLVLLCFLVVYLDLRLNMIYLKLQLKSFVDSLFYNLIAWLLYTESDNAENDNSDNLVM